MENIENIENAENMEIKNIDKIIFETIEYFVNYHRKRLHNYDKLKQFIKKCIDELESDIPNYRTKNHITTKTNITYYLTKIKKENENDLREKLSDKEIETMLCECSRVPYLQQHISSEISFSHLLEYYYLTKLYFYKHILVKCLKNYIKILHKYR